MTEIRFASGRVSEIGEFVDSLFDSMPDRFVQGINCEILLVDDLNYQIMTTDFQSIRKINIDRVSRHKAPEFLYQISYSNGRDVIVTPEHPVYTYTMAGISTIDASKLQPDAFVPGIRELNFNSCTTIFETNFTSGRKRLILPSQLNLSFSLFLGYCVSEGYSYKSSTHEVGLSNSDPVIISKMISCIRETFGIEPIDDTTRNKRIRIISKNVYEYLHHNFKELMMYSSLKRIPASIFSATDDYRIAFLSTAFEGDGLIEAESLCYCTTSKKLAGDYQDLLSTIDIQTRIIVENYLFADGKQHLSRFKVYIRGDSLIQFVETVIPHYSDHSQVSYLLRRSSPRNCSGDVLPGQVAEIIIRIMKQLGLTYSGEFGRVQTQNQGITIISARKYLRKIRSRIKFICDNIDKTQDLKAIQHLLAYPQARVGSILQMKRAIVGYKERKSISNQELVFDLKSHFKSILDEVSKQVDSIEDLMSFQWVRVKKVEKIPNSGPGKINWVYDVTIEPTGNFISNNLILHNTVSIAKAGIVATLNSRTAVMAAANPKYGRYEPHRTFSENVNLSPAILSRFDLVFVLRDTPELKEDTRMASHILKLHRLHGTAQSIKPPLTADQLKKYIAFAKSNYNPVLTEEAAEVLEEFYVTMRNTYGSSDDGGSRGRVTITARQLEGIIRLAEARARAALRNQVTKQDAVKAVELMKDSLSHTAIDPATGEADIDALFSPHTTARRSKLSTLVSLIDFLNKQYSGKPFPQETLLEEAEKEGLNRDYITGVIRQMLRDGALYQPKAGTLKKPDT
ncbi:MAG: hypothetical protein IH840_15480 [Candidatus Heimdallarchaeota archaeon]|nr:hypothetical protein [Candidatus Heimdallarchaeota archaeon]